MKGQAPWELVKAYADYKRKRIAQGRRGEGVMTLSQTAGVWIVVFGLKPAFKASRVTPPLELGRKLEKVLECAIRIFEKHPEMQNGLLLGALLKVPVREKKVE